MTDALSLIAVPLGAGALATISHSVLGRQVLARGIVFIDLAIAQFAALGLLVGAVFGLHGWEQTALGIAAAMCGAGLVALLCRAYPTRREAAIGMLYVSGASLAVMIASIDPHGMQRVAQLLAGDPLWVTGQALWPLLVATVPFIWVMLSKPGWLEDGRFFYPVFALMISLSLPLLGLYLVFATLIIPALLIDWIRSRHALLIAMCLGTLGYTAGLTVSLVLDLPSGPSIVVAMVAIAMIFALMTRLTKA